MVKYFENSMVFPFSWSQVAQGYWMRYPNPFSMHVLTEDTISREIKDGKLYSKRLLTKTNRAPKWAERFVTIKVAKIIEESIIDPKEKVIVTYTKNIGNTKVMSITEKVVYKVSDENSDWTVARRSAWIDSNIFGFSRAIKAFGYDRYKKNCSNMSEGFNYVLAHLFPHTAQYVHSNLSQMADQATHMNLQHTFQEKAEKMKDAAKKAKDLAKQKTNPISLAYQQNQ